MKLKDAMAEGYGLTKWRHNGFSDGYFPHWEYNVYGNYMKERFVKMFAHGSGCELDTKGAAIHSSSMFGYNFFHWIDEDNPASVYLKDNNIAVEVTKVGFEAQMKTLPSSNAPANMDVVLLSKNEETLLLIESKLLEYNTPSAFDIPKSYLHPSKYYGGMDGDMGKIWPDLIRECKESFKQKSQYYEGIKQNICHLIAIMNLAKGYSDAKNWFADNNKTLEIDISKIKEFHFINAIFDPASRFKSESESFDNYKKLHKKFQSMLKGKLPSNVSISFIPYSELWNNFIQKDQKMPKDLVKFLSRRYMEFSSIAK